MHSNKLVRSFSIAGLLLLGCTGAFATPLTPGSCVGQSTVSCPGTLDIFTNITGSTFVVGVTSAVTGSNASGTTLYTGTLTSAVYRNAGGTLDFYYQFANAAQSLDAISRITTTSFAGFLTDVGYAAVDIDGAGKPTANFSNGSVIPVFADRQASGTVGFSFASGAYVTPGSTSEILVIKTNATQWVPGTTNTLNGAIATVNTFAPSAVPEPATMALLGLSLVGLAAFRRKL